MPVGRFRLWVFEEVVLVRSHDVRPIRDEAHARRIAARTVADDAATLHWRERQSNRVTDASASDDRALERGLTRALLRGDLIDVLVEARPFAVRPGSPLRGGDG